MRDSHPVCPTCRYDLTGLEKPRCPECGRAFTEEEWSDRSLLVPAPAWERRGRINIVYAFVATIIAMTFRPRRFLRRVRTDEGVLGVVAFALFLVPAAWLLSIMISLIAGELGYFVKGWLPNPAYWEGHLIARDGDWSSFARNSIRLAIHCSAFLLTPLLVWLPTLVALDLLFWRDRRPFRLLAKVFLYTNVWWCVVGAVAASLGRAIMEQIDIHWAWGAVTIGGVVHPWICWVGAILATFQLGALSSYARSMKTTAAWATPRGIIKVRMIVFVGWLLAVFLLLIDRHVHLRFHLLLIDDELWQSYRQLL